MSDSHGSLHAADEDLQPLDNQAADLRGGVPSKGGDTDPGAGPSSPIKGPVKNPVKDPTAGPLDRPTLPTGGVPAGLAGPGSTK